MNELTLWRYLSHEKWEFFLRDKGIYFSKASNFKDKKEGHYDVQDFYSSLKELVPESIEVVNQAERLHQNIRDRSPDYNYISCWQNMDDESITMWKEYVPESQEGVLIRSDVLSLLLNRPDSLSEIITGVNCKYYQGENDNYNEKYPFEFKESKYSHEKEFRLILNSMKMQVLTGFNPDGFGEVSTLNDKNEWVPFHQQFLPKDAASDILVKPEQGYVVKYPLEKIIHEIRVHPMASDLYLSKIRADLIDVDIKCQVNRSTISPEAFNSNQ